MKLVEETITQICDYLLKKFGRVISDFHLVFSKTLFLSFKILVVYLAIFVVCLAKPEWNS